jgi:hypothetical protein
MSGPPAEPGTQALAESLAALAAQLADLRGQVAQVNQRLDRAGLRGDLDLVARFEELARSVAETLDAAAPRGPAAPSWLGLDREAYLAELAELRRWADTVLRQHYSGYELRDCWPCHIHAVWERSPPPGITRTAASALTWPAPWSSMTAGCPAPCAASRTSPAHATPIASRAATAPGDRPAPALPHTYHRVPLLVTGGPNLPLRTPAMNARHSSGVYRQTGPRP